MGFHLYCIVDGGRTPAPGLRGLEGALVTSVAVSDLAVWCSAADRRPQPDLEGVRMHDRVIRRAGVDETPLPFRFGQWFRDREALEAAVLEGLDGYRQALARVSGAVEFALRLHAAGRSARPRSERGGGTSGGRPETWSSEGTTGGAAFLRELARREAERARDRRRGEALLAELNERLADRVRQACTDRSPARGSLASGAHLVPRPGVQEYLDAVRGLAPLDGAVEIDVSGPWPPYSFA